MANERQPGLIGLDWGASSLHGYHMATCGRGIESIAKFDDLQDLFGASVAAGLWEIARRVGLVSATRVTAGSLLYG
jgi:hypothetical protein